MPVAPVSVAESCTELPTVTGFADSVVATDVQLLIVTCSGGMKSFSSAVNEVEERLFR